MQAYFSSLVGGDQLREHVLETLREALVAGLTKPIDVHIMTFSFTDERIATFLEAMAIDHPNVTIRLIADWGQGSRVAGRRVHHLARLRLPNLVVRYKRDQPYRWDADRGRLRWSYRASRGLLHHKTLGIRIDGAMWRLVCGSFNWTAKAAASYENLLIVTADTADAVGLMQSVQWEFEAMWCDSRVTVSPDEARAHYLKILDEYRADPAKSPGEIVGLETGEPVGLAGPHARRGADATEACAGTTSMARPASDADARLAIAFSSPRAHETGGARGYSPHNSRRRFALYKPSGKVKDVPLTITALALDVIARARPGETLKVAMYALSARVAEYGALVEAARRGVRVQILLDGAVGLPMLTQLSAVRDRDALPIDVRAGRRMMHQKYIVHPDTHTVLTGTANLSTDASGRHSEQRILIRGDRGLTERFVADFDTIWARLRAHDRPRQTAHKSPQETR